MPSIGECLKVAGLAASDIRELAPKISRTKDLEGLISKEISKLESKISKTQKIIDKFNVSKSTEQIESVKEQPKEKIPRSISGMISNLQENKTIESGELLGGKVVVRTKDGELKEFNRDDFRKFYMDNALVKNLPKGATKPTSSIITEAPKVEEVKPAKVEVAPKIEETKPVEQVMPIEEVKPTKPTKDLVEKDNLLYRSDGKPFSKEVTAKFVIKRKNLEGYEPVEVEGGWALKKSETKPVVEENKPITEKELKTENQKVSNGKVIKVRKKSKPQEVVEKVSTSPPEEVKDVNQTRRDIGKRAKELLKQKTISPEDADALEEATSKLLFSKTRDDFKEDWEWEEFNDLNNTLLNVVNKVREKAGGESLIEEPEVAPVEDVLDLDTTESLETYLKEHGGTITLDFMGLQKAYEKSVEALKKTPEAYEHLRRIAKGVMLEGKTKFSEFKLRMKEILGDTYNSVKHLILKVWKEAKEWNKKLRDLGFFGSVEGAKDFAFERANKLADEAQDRMDEAVREGDKEKYELAKKQHFAATRRMYELSDEDWEPKTLKQAKRMLAKGVDRFEIFTKTGWLRGPEGKWRFEIDDREAKVTLPKKIRNTNSKIYKLEDILKSDALYKAYPELKDLGVELFNAEELPDESLGAFDGEKIELAIKNRKADLTLLHEVQHAIQNIEGLSRGGSASKVGPMTAYNAAKVLFRDKFDEVYKLKKELLEMESDINERLKSEGLKEIGNFFPDTLEEYYKKHGASDGILNSIRELSLKQSKLNKLISETVIRDVLKRKVAKTSSLLADKLLSAVFSEHPVEDDWVKYLVYKILTGETEARDVEFRHTLSNLKSVPPALLTKHTLPLGPGESVSVSKSIDRISRESDKKLTKKMIEKRENKLKITDLDISDIAELAKVKNFNSLDIKNKVFSLYGKKSLTDLSKQEADELKIVLAKEPVKPKNEIVDYVKSLKSVSKGAKSRLEWAARVYEVGENELARFISTASDGNKITTSSINKAVRMIKLARDIEPVYGESSILGRMAPMKRLLGENFMRVFRKYEVRRLESMMPYIYKANNIFHKLSDKSLEAITLYREGKLRRDDLSPKELKVNDELTDVYNKLYYELGIDKEKIESYSPRVKKRFPDLPSYVFSRRGMKEIKFWANMVRTGELRPTELNAKKLLMRYINAGFRAKYYNKAIEEIKPIYDSLDPTARKFADEFINYALKKIPTKFEQSANETAKAIFRRLHIKHDPNSRLFKDLVGAVMDFNYSAFMGLRPKLAIRNKLQESLVWTEYGLGNWLRGRTKAWGKEIDEALKNSDVYKLRKKEYLVTDEKVNRLRDIPREVREAMMIMYRAADIDNVRVAFSTGYFAAKAKGLPLEECIRAGEKAIHATQWGYGMDLPMLLQTTMGRAGGQYLSWPMWYLDHISRIIKERQGGKAARTFIQYAILYFLMKKYGINYLKSVGLGVVPTSLGGYLPGVVISGARLASALGSADMDRIEKSGKEFFERGVMDLIPGYLAAKDLRRLYESGDWKRFLLYAKKKKKLRF